MIHLQKTKDNVNSEGHMGRMGKFTIKLTVWDLTRFIKFLWSRRTFELILAFQEEPEGSLLLHKSSNLSNNTYYDYEDATYKLSTEGDHELEDPHEEDEKEDLTTTRSK